MIGFSQVILLRFSSKNWSIISMSSIFFKNQYQSRPFRYFSTSNIGAKKNQPIIKLCATFSRNHSWNCSRPFNRVGTSDIELNPRIKRHLVRSSLELIKKRNYTLCLLVYLFPCLFDVATTAKLLHKLQWIIVVEKPKPNPTRPNQSKVVVEMNPNSIEPAWSLWHSHDCLRFFV